MEDLPRCEEIGTVTAIIANVRTMTDGSCRISFDLGQQDAKVASKLLERALQNKELVQLGIIGIEHD